MPVPDDEASDSVAVDHLSESEVEAEALSEGDIGADQLQDPTVAAHERPGAEGKVTPEQASGAPDPQRQPRRRLSSRQLG